MSSNKSSGIGVSRSASTVSASPSSSGTTTKTSDSTTPTRQGAAAAQHNQLSKVGHAHVTRTHSFPKTSPLASMEYQVRLRNHGVRPSPRPITNITQAQLRSHNGHSFNSVAQTRSQSMLISSADEPISSPTHRPASDPEENETKSKSLPATVNDQPETLPCPTRTSASSTAGTAHSPRLGRKSGKSHGSRGHAGPSLIPSASASVHPGLSANASVSPPNVAVGATGSTAEPSGATSKDKEKEKRRESNRLPVSSYLLKKLSAGIPTRIKKSRSPVPDPSSRPNACASATTTSSSPQSAPSPHRLPSSSTSSSSGSQGATPTTVSSSSTSSSFPSSPSSQAAKVTPSASQMSQPAYTHQRSASAPKESSQVPGGASCLLSTHHKKSSSADCHHASPLGKPGKVKPLQRQRYRCIAPYPPQSDTELELKVNEIVYVHKKRDDGWYKGTLQASGKTGLFPGSFVEKC